MSRRRTPRRLLALVIAVMVLMLVEVGVVVTVFVSPSASEHLGDAAASVDRTWTGTKGRPGVRTKIADAVAGGYRSWIEPIWRGPQPARAADAAFSACVKCHTDYASKRRFSTVYMNHPLHAEQGVACQTCHVQNEHPNPVRPEERTCSTCHDEVQQRGKCSLCHPPASLPHFYLLGAPRDQVVDCAVCHPKQSFKATATTRLVDVKTFDGSDKAECVRCHQQTTCSSCHATPHPSDWVSIHGAQVGEDPTPCYSCHTGNWCTSRCHAVTSTNPFVPQPLPSTGVRP